VRMVGIFPALEIKSVLVVGIMPVRVVEMVPVLVVGITPDLARVVADTASTNIIVQEIDVTLFIVFAPSDLKYQGTVVSLRSLSLNYPLG
jgi:hypothetical protein